MKTDIQIARECELKPISDIASQLGIAPEEIEPYGRYMAKIPVSHIDEERVKQSRLILVTAISPTKAGIGKTTVSIGLTLGLNKIGKKAVVALREPSLGPCFGIKGGAAGGGYAQVLPMEKINLHFTGDFHAVTSAHNTISALLDNYLFQHRKDGFSLREIFWKRVLDVNDRALRNVVTGLRGDGVVSETGFDITPASELMAILCLATSEEDLQRRIENIVLGITADGKLFKVKDLGVAGAITVLLRDALMPNLVQTTENTPAFIHGGPFANIAHGCSSVLATKMAMTYSDYVVTEAGFGADLGAEKFFDIKCRKTGLQPRLVVIVATTQGLKMHGGVNLDHIKEPNAAALCQRTPDADYCFAVNVLNNGQSMRGIVLYGDAGNYVALVLRNKKLQVVSKCNGKETITSETSMKKRNVRLQAEVKDCRKLSFMYDDGSGMKELEPFSADASHTTPWDRVARPGVISAVLANSKEKPAEFSEFKIWKK
jgi:formate--tetrahydrofolate ligase